MNKIILLLSIMLIGMMGYAQVEKVEEFKKVKKPIRLTSLERMEWHAGSLAAGKRDSDREWKKFHTKNMAEVRKFGEEIKKAYDARPKERVCGTVSNYEIKVYTPSTTSNSVLGETYDVTVGYGNTSTPVRIKKW